MPQRSVQDSPETRAQQVVHTPDGLPGFDAAREWVLDHGDDTVFGVLRNVEEPEIGLLVTEPWDLAPGYEPDLPDDELQRIGIHEAADVQVLVVATIGSSGSISASASSGERTIWLNLAAPITVNVRTRQARQVILDRQGWPLRHPVASSARS